MQAALDRTCPLSPYMWAAPPQVIVGPGSKVGKVADVLKHVADLELNMELIAKERIAPYEHPVNKVFETHPVHTRALNKRQFDVLRYGMVLDEQSRLVLVPAPRGCADSGVRVAHKFKAIFNASLNDTEIAAHTLLPEYCFLVYQLPTEEEIAEKGPAGAVPLPLFRIVFRNEAYQENPLAEMCEQFPLFRLRAVFVSNAVYYPLMEEIYSFRSSNPPFFKTMDGRILPNPRIEHLFAKPEMELLCNSWLKVIDGIAPAWVKEKGLGPDVVGLFLKTHRAKATSDVQDREEDYTAHQVDNRVRLTYLSNMQRMQQRVQVVKREGGIISRWRDGEFDVEYYREENEGPEPAMGVAKCARIILKPTRGGPNRFEDGEITAFVPRECEYKEQRVYRTPAAECLRLWVLKGLMTAELHGAHSVILDIDPTLLLSQCVGLLWGGDDHTRTGEVKFHVCKIVVETVEDYIQHSGVIWQATLAVFDENNMNTSDLCEEILALAQSSKHRMEQEEHRKEEEREQEAQRAATRRELFEQHVRNRNAANQPEHGGKSYYDRIANSLGNGDDGEKTKLVPYQKPAFSTLNLVNSIPQPIVHLAAMTGIHVRDEDLYPVFDSLCSPPETTIPVSTLVAVMLVKLGAADPRSSPFWPNDHPLLVLDHCGIPCNEKSITNFVMSFCLRPYRSRSKAVDVSSDDAQAATEEIPSLNYIEFSMMMLALARQ